MNLKNSIYMVILLSFVCAAAVATPMAPPSAQRGAGECTVQITEPRPGQAVALNAIVEGTATLPFDHHLWLFARPVFTFRTLGKWWPQGEGIVDAAGAWKLPATFGSPQKNIGEDFDVTAAVFAPQRHAQLVDYLEKAMNAHDFQPIRMPAVACASAVATVVKRTD